MNDSTPSPDPIVPTTTTRTPAESTRDRLLAAFGGSVDGWRLLRYQESDPVRGFTHCVCGHFAKDLYVWRHEATGREVATGSACVNFVPELPADDLAVIREDVRNRARAQREERRIARLAANAEYESDLVKAIVLVRQEIHGPVRRISGMDSSELAQLQRLKTPERRLELLESTLEGALRWLASKREIDALDAA